MGRGRVGITGTNFRLPLVPPPGGSDPPLTGPVGGEFVPTVKITFDGLDADGVIPVSTTFMWVITPEYRGSQKLLPNAIDVVVTNLDDSGVPIPTETVTVADGFTYRRQDLTAESDVAWVTRNIIRRLQRNVIGNVNINTWFDFSTDPTSGLTAISELPAVLLQGPDVVEDTDNRETEDQLSDAGGDDVFVTTPPFTARLLWRILLLSDGKLEAQNMQNLITNNFMARPSLVIETFEGSGQLVDLEVFIDGGWAATDEFGDGLHAYSSVLRCQGLVLDVTVGVQTGGIPQRVIIAPFSDDLPTIPAIDFQPGLT